MPRRPIIAADDPRRSGFTLTELLIVISIIAVLIAILIPAIGGARNTARKSATTALMTTVSNAISQYRTHNNRLPGYFSQHELAHRDNNTGFTQMENALLDLAGGVEDQSVALGGSVLEVPIPDRPTPHVKINVAKVGASDGPGYLPLTAKGVGTLDPQSGGMAQARVPGDQMTTIVSAGGNYTMPDILDSWGKPIMLWSKNEAAGVDPPPLFAQDNAPSSSSNPAAFYYWRTNMGYLTAPVQANSSALGPSPGITEMRRQRTMAALLGDPAFPNPDPSIPSDTPTPLSGKGDFVLQSAGVDGVFLGNKGNSSLEFRYLPSGANPPGVPNPNGPGGSGWYANSDWALVSQTDDLTQPGN